MSQDSLLPTARLAGKAGWRVGNVKVEYSYAANTNRPPNGYVTDFGYEGERELGFQAADYETSLAKRKHEREVAQDRARQARIRGARTSETVMRSAIIERDASTCYLCGKVCQPQEIHLDHVIPVSKSGTHTADNLKVACAPCNLRKGDRLLAA